jgi:pimeloyl-ACP methyl ester carboxylesterase
MAPLRKPLAGLLLALALVCGCSSITVRRHTGDILESVRDSITTTNEVSPRTRQTLRRLGLEEIYLRDAGAAAVQLHQLALREPKPELLFALAEIHYVRGRQAEHWNCSAAVGYYYLCAGYAYHYLFATADNPHLAPRGAPLAPLTPLNAFDPRFRLACDLYNTGLSKCIAAAQRVGQLDPRRELHLPTPDGKAFTLSVVHKGFAWKPEEFGPVLFCQDLEVVGLENEYHTYGLGVPLIATRTAGTAEPEPSPYPRGTSFPVTAFFRFDGTLADLAQGRVGQLELYNPLTVQVVEVRGRSVPLETDLTTPLAYFLSNTDLDNFKYTGFLHPDKVENHTGIYMLEPYQPGKIPVLMIHGLLSSPVTWSPLFNDLRADPVLRHRYQFWFYNYPTSDPYLATAADLRQSLDQLRARVDPQHQDPAFDEMVLVGHSMGGLVSRLLTVDSGNDFWQLVSDKPFENVKLLPDAAEELRRVFFFDRYPSVKRVVFLGTPHHGSKLSPSPLGRLAVHLAQLPRTLMWASRDLVNENPDLLPRLQGKSLPTSVDLLAPGAPALELLASRCRPEGVHYHSIIGVTTSKTADLERFLAGDGKEPGDGVVPYTSAHLPQVDSELVVPADHHHVHQHPLAVLEVRRILLEHIQGGGAGPR